MTVGTAVTTYTYDANNRLIRTVEGDTVTDYTYDANGNTLTKVCGLSNTTYTYNGLDQQLTATVNGVTTSYAYNAQGIRTAKQTGTTRTDYLLDVGNVIGEVENGTISAQYLRGFNLISREAEETEYYLFNAHGDVVNLTDSTGAVTRTYDYDAFGNEVNPDSADPNPFRYCGEYWDPETATYYLRARYYAPSIGRFTQQDTHWNTANMIYGDNPQKINEREDKLGLKTYSYTPQISAIVQSGNLYVYCGSNPVYYLDSSGNFFIPAYVAYEVLAALLAATSAVFTANTAWSIQKKSISIPQTGLSGLSWRPNIIVVSREGLMQHIAMYVLSRAIARIDGDDSTALHHIVAKGSYKAKEAQQILASFGIDYKTDERNLVRLKTRVHYYIHTDAYYALVNQLISAAYNDGLTEAEKEALVLKTLAELKAFLTAVNEMA